MANTTSLMRRFILPVLFILFLVSMTFGQLVSVSLGNGVFVYAHDFLLALVLVAGYGSVMKNRLVVQPKFIQPIIIFIIVGVVSLVVNLLKFGIPGILLSSLYLFRWFMYADLYVLLTQQVISSDFILWGVYSMGTAVSLFGIIQFFLYPNLRFLMYLGWDPHYYRLFSTFFDPNFAGIFITLTALLGFWLYEKRRNWLLIAPLAINGVAIYLTYSRSAYLAIIAGTLTWFVWQKRWRVGLGLALIITLILLIPRPGGKTLSLFRADSTMARLGNWQESVPIILSAPVLGHGFDTLRLLHDARFSTNPDGFISHSAAGLDSSILFVLATTGLVGLLSFGWLVISITRVFMHKTWLISAAFAALLVHSLFVNSLFYAWVMLWVWMVVGGFELEFRPK